MAPATVRRGEKLRITQRSPKIPARGGLEARLAQGRLAGLEPVAVPEVEPGHDLAAAVVEVHLAAVAQAPGRGGQAGDLQVPGARGEQRPRMADHVAALHIVQVQALEVERRALPGHGLPSRLAVDLDPPGLGRLAARGQAELVAHGDPARR